MPLEIIGAGFGRTGTRSLKDALETLGFGPCHHMSEVHNNPAQPAIWDALADGAAIDWETVFDGYRSQVDWPGAAFWRELAEAYPQARVILTLRSPESWHRSVTATIGRYLTDEIQPETGRTRMAYRLITRNIFDGKVDDPEHAMRVFEEHNAEVQRTIAPERLLVLPVGSGWQPLCDFLGVPVPDAPYSSRNSTEEFNARRPDE